MKKTIVLFTLLASLSLNLFAQKEIPMFFNSEPMLVSDDLGLFIRELAYSPDGSKIATAFNDGNIILWDAETGREIRRFDGHSSRNISGLLFSPNSRILVSFAQYDSVIKIWDTISGELLSSIAQGGVQAIAFSPDGSRIVATFSGLRVDAGTKIWNTANGGEVRTLQTELVSSVEYSPDGRYILTARGQSINIWDAVTGQVIRNIQGERTFRNAVYSPNGRFLVAYDFERRSFNAIQIFNSETGQEIRTISLQRQLSWTDLIFSPDGRQLLVNMSDGNTNPIIVIFDLETGRELRSFNAGGRAVAYSPNGQRILTNSHTFRLIVEEKNYGGSFTNIIDTNTGRIIGTIGYGPLNIGAKAYFDLLIAHFLNDNNTVSRSEVILQFITSQGFATRQEIEAFYRNNVRNLISTIVDNEFRGITVPHQTVSYVKESVSSFLLTPNQANFNTLRSISRAYTEGNLDYIIQSHNTNMANLETARSLGLQDMINSFSASTRQTQNILNERRRQLRAPNDSPIDWRDFHSGYRRILNSLNEDLTRRVMQ